MKNKIHLFRKKRQELKNITIKRAPYEEREKVHSLAVVFTIVNRDQSKFYTDAYQKAGASMSLVLFAHSQPPEEIASVLGDMNLRKDIVITFVRSEDAPGFLEIARKRFEISKAAKGVAFTCPIEAVNGIAVYRFLADQSRELRKEESQDERKQ